MNSNDVAAKLDAQLNIKMPKSLLDGLLLIKEKHGIEPAESLRRAGEAMVQFYRKNGYFSFPVVITPEAEFIQAVVKTSAQPPIITDSEARAAALRQTAKAKKTA